MKKIKEEKKDEKPIQTKFRRSEAKLKAEKEAVETKAKHEAADLKAKQEAADLKAKQDAIDLISKKEVVAPINSNSAIASTPRRAPQPPHVAYRCASLVLVSRRNLSHKLGTYKAPRYTPYNLTSVADVHI